ncbi:unnamed protein product [Auanema sp. JU1783]|nr:unnamed protein product [Auanema sp. JU1783]
MFSQTLVLVALACMVRATPVPEQVHLSFRGDFSNMAVSWITFEDDTTVVSYGESSNNLNKVAKGTQEVWEFEGITRYVHRALMTNLKESTRYYYQIKNRSFNFKTLAANPQSHKVCIFGDLGFYHGNSTQSIIQNGLNGKFDFVIHVGDISYDLHTNKGQNGDNYMNQLEPLISTMPYMVIAGNHEDDGKNFSHYQKRFWMPDNGYQDNQFYSFQIGPVQYVGVSTENYGSFNYYGMEPVLTQYSWLQNEFQNANKNRENTPWLIIFQHRPFYCSNDNSAECKSFENRLVREGWLDMPGLEGLFLQSGVDLGFYGHEHAYERNWPIANKEYWAGDQYLHNSPAPIYVLTGSAGCHTPNATFGNPWPWSAARNNDYGWSIMTVANNTHIHVEQVSIDKHEAVVDEFWTSKDKDHVHNEKMRRTIGGSAKMPSMLCPVNSPACRRTLMQINTEL